MKKIVKKTTKLIGRAFGVSDIRDDIANGRKELFELRTEIMQLRDQIDRMKSEVLDRQEYIGTLIKRTHDITKVPSAMGDEKLLQDGNFILFKTIKELLEKNNVEYFLNFGILIGLERHGGFVPWDDDIDISVAREDYERLPDIFKKAFKNTELKCVRGEIIRIYYGSTPLQLDIFPIDFTEKKMNDEEKRVLLRKIEKYHALLGCNWNNLWKQKKVTPMSYEEMRELFARTVTSKTISKKEAKETKPAIILNAESPQRYVFDYDMIFPLKKRQLFGIDVFVPNRIEKILSAYYGDYFSFPNNIHHKHDDIEVRKSLEALESVRRIVTNGSIEIN